jgi:hypothetical protein
VLATGKRPDFTQDHAALAEVSLVASAISRSWSLAYRCP